MRKLLVLLFTALVILAGCSPEENVQEVEQEAIDNTEKTSTSKSSETTINLNGIPIRIEAEKVNNDADVELAVVLDSGEIQRFRVVAESGQLTELTEKQTAKTVPQPKGNLQVPPLLLEENEFVYIDQNGDVVFWSEEQELERLAINALPDSNLLVGDKNQVLVLTQPSTRYDHGILGDQIEATGFAIIDGDKKEVVQETSVPQKDVIESLKPIWVDWDQNGTKEIILTLSNDQEGARLVLYDEAGKQLAEGEPLGQSHRWRHALTVEAFHSTDKLELAEITTPHIGGNLQFIEWDQENKRLKVVASGSEYSTHSIGSKNLDMHTSVDSNSDGQIELWVPSQRKDELIGIQRTAEGFETIKQFALQGNLSSNIVSVSSEKQSMLVAGTDSATVTVWTFVE
ncbi:hypothetical protein [Planococcus donghaensis]|uniref:Uncharacterized protein n=1 Tax=Planococcus donghaensis TaxID=414778 RepID=A0A1C7EEQ8_9BACL|nr:hypothetical protein [Planococcus donghaensis]ANU21872.1 hypothetical protein BCM40_00340 [Planococcus donghaensis]